MKPISWAGILELEVALGGPSPMQVGSRPGRSAAVLLFHANVAAALAYPSWNVPLFGGYAKRSQGDGAMPWVGGLQRR
ncbi:MAG: hypothetical protein U0905_18990 [Pirellulales bacterium]